MAGGLLLVRIYNFVNGQVLFEHHLDEEFNQIADLLNGKLGDKNIALDAEIAGTKLAIASIPLDRLAATVTTSVDLDTHSNSADHDERYYTESEVDAKLLEVVAGDIPEGSIPLSRLAQPVVAADGSVEMEAPLIIQGETAATYNGFGRVNDTEKLQGVNGWDYAGGQGWLPADDDWDTRTSAAIFKVQPGGLNRPPATTLEGILKVEVTGNAGILQTYYPNHDTEGSWTRIRYSQGGTWTAWAQSGGGSLTESRVRAIARRV